MPVHPTQGDEIVDGASGMRSARRCSSASAAAAKASQVCSVMMGGAAIAAIATSFQQSARFSRHRRKAPTLVEPWNTGPARPRSRAFASLSHPLKPTDQVQNRRVSATTDSRKGWNMTSAMQRKQKWRASLAMTAWAHVADHATGLVHSDRGPIRGALSLTDPRQALDRGHPFDGLRRPAPRQGRQRNMASEAVEIRARPRWPRRRCSH